MVSQGYDASYLMDYEDGPTPEEFFLFHSAAVRSSAERSRANVQELMVALGSLFDKKVLQGFNEATERILKTVERAQEQSMAGASVSPEEKKRRDMEKTMRNLDKLARIMG